MEMHKTYLKRFVRQKIASYQNIFPAVGILGPRQCGKSTLIKHFLKDIENVAYFDLEKYDDLAKVTENPLSFFNTHKDKIVCLDEIQKLPHIFATMRGVIDKNRKNGRFFILGSASPKLIKQTSESLAGRIGYIELTPFHILEVLSLDIKSHWVRGGFPESYLAVDNKSSFIWRDAYLKNIIERDIQEFRKIDSVVVLKLLRFLAHYHGQRENYAELAKNFSVGEVVIKSYIDTLESMYLVRRLPSYFKNSKKRLIKSPKWYIRDSGLLHVVARIHNKSELIAHPLYGNSFEGYVIENLLSVFDDCEGSYYRTSNGEEVDLILQKNNKIIAIEIKTSKTPSLTKSCISAIKNIKPDHTCIVVPYYENAYDSKQEYGDLTIGSLSQTIEKIKKIF
ncbi:MAG: ATP-binding protein [Patescibacteria group bacterium]|nr:ATP-binding protein [Patescibacteria group bacterium]